MDKQFFLLDIDGTLLDQKYHYNTDLLEPLITKLQSSGVVFSLNSNRAIEDLVSVANLFNIQGPLIGENGAFSYIDGKYIILLTPAQQNFFVKGKKRIKKEIINFFEQQKGKRVYWEDVDTVKVLSQQVNHIYPNGSILVLNNKFRKFSISSHIKYVENNKIYDDTAEVPELTDYLKKLNIEGLEINYSSLFWNLLVTVKNVTKRTALDLLKRNQYNNYSFSAIGDEYTDYLMIKDLGSFYTVNNAQKEAKDVAKMISNYSYTKGVYDIINSTFNR